MDQGFYQTSQFAEKASVTVRTLRYYDNVGLLSPTGHTEAGYRLYTDTDLFRLQQILALKFLGFSLGEIKYCLQIGPSILQESLAFQRSMMQEKRRQLDIVISAIDETEKLLQANHHDWQAVVNVIQVIQMSQNNDWRNNYFTDEQLAKMDELSKKAYTDEDRQKIAEWGKNWSEEDQQRATQQWNALFAELNRLYTSGSDPASPEAQALAERWHDLISQFTHNDPGVTQGLKNYYQGYGELPTNERPFSLPYGKDENGFIQKALDIYSQKQS